MGADKVAFEHALIVRSEDLDSPLMVEKLIHDIETKIKGSDSANVLIRVGELPTRSPFGTTTVHIEDFTTVLDLMGGEASPEVLVKLNKILEERKPEGLDAAIATGHHETKPVLKYVYYKPAVAAKELKELPGGKSLPPKDIA